MTMHAAKGLEFPIVLLPSLHSKTPSSSRFFFDRELGYGWNWSFNKEDFRPAVVALMSLRETWKDRAEEARLFYVALTRARDLLIVSGEYDREHPPKDTMLNWALAPFDEIPEENSSLPLLSPSLRFLDSDGATERAEPWEQFVDFHLDIGDLPKYAPFRGERLPFRAELVMIGELPARAEGEIYSASQLLVYSQCPTKYYLKYRLGIPEDLETAYRIDADTRDSEDGTLFARLFRMTAVRIDEMEREETGGAGEPLREEITQRHREQRGGTEKSAEELLQAIEHTSPTVAEVIDETLRLEPLTAAQHAVVRPRLIETFERIFASDPACAALFPSGTTASVEQELRMPFEREYVMGVMDRMLVSDDGTISILHYKTLRLDRDAVVRTAESYLPQLRLYAYLVAALNPAQRSVRATILFTEHPDSPQQFTFTRFDMMRIEEEVRAAIADIRQISYTGRRQLPLKSPHCPLCPYWIQEQCLLGRVGR
jgi:ATP-dependent helicase/nuclease subunit A